MTKHLYPIKDQRNQGSSIALNQNTDLALWMFCVLQKAFINGMRYTGLCRTWLLWEWAAGLESLAWSPCSGKSTAPQGLPEERIWALPFPPWSSFPSRFLLLSGGD